MDLRTKREEHYDNCVEEWKKEVEHGQMRRVTMFYKKLGLSYQTSAEETRAYMDEKFRRNHEKTGLPKGVLEWFHCQELVHQGPHGQVYKAHDLHGRTVAVKLRD